MPDDDSREIASRLYLFIKKEKRMRKERETLVRYAKKEEIGPIQELRREVNTLHAKGRPDMFKSGFGKELQEHIYVYMTSENNRVAVDVREGQVVGMVMFDWIDRPENAYAPARKFCHIAEICVAEPFRGQGVGHALMDFVKEEARHRGVHRIELDVWDFNDVLEFYEKEGFTVFRRYLEIKL